jgi:hypothetical protein
MIFPYFSKKQITFPIHLQKRGAFSQYIRLLLFFNPAASPDCPPSTPQNPTIPCDVQRQSLIGNLNHVCCFPREQYCFHPSAIHHRLFRRGRRTQRSSCKCTAKIPLQRRGTREALMDSFRQGGALRLRPRRPKSFETIRIRGLMSETPEPPRNASETPCDDPGS